MRRSANLNEEKAARPLPATSTSGLSRLETVFGKKRSTKATQVRLGKLSALVQDLTGLHEASVSDLSFALQSSKSGARRWIKDLEAIAVIEVVRYDHVLKKDRSHPTYRLGQNQEVIKALLSIDQMTLEQSYCATSLINFNQDSPIITYNDDGDEWAVSSVEFATNRDPLVTALFGKRYNFEIETP